jgi:aryl-alcohol dehydrogenase-like predicted oxidoreductase
MAKTIDRRDFLRLGAASVGSAIGCGSEPSENRFDQPPPEMRYRALGATGLEVSEVAFGAHGVDNPTLMAAALEAGINTFCTSGEYMDGREEEALGEAIRRIGVPREQIVILTGNDPRDHSSVQSALQQFDASLARLQTDYLDVYCNAMVQTREQVQLEPLFEAFEKARTAGKVRHLAIAGHHGGMQDCMEAGIQSGRYGAFFTKYDFVSYPEQDEIIHRAAGDGIGTMVFKVHAGNRKHEIKDLEAGGLSFRQATVKWALRNPDISSVALTLTNFDEIREAVSAVGAPLERREVAMLRRYADEMRDRYCRFCGTCEAACPTGVAVADIMRYEMYSSCYGRQSEACRLYRTLPTSASAAACADCAGACSGACPFGRGIRSGLIGAHRVLGARST